MTALTLPAGVERHTLPSPRGPLAALHTPGDGRSPVVFVSGYFGSKEDFRAIMPLLAEGGHAGWAYDHLGQYESPGPAEAEAYTFGLLAGDLRTVLREVSDGRPVHLIGHCLGGFVARTAALADPGAIRTLTLLGCGPAMRDARHKPMLAGMDRMLDKDGLEPLWPIVKRVLPADDETLHRFWRDKLDTISHGFVRGTTQALREEPDRTAELTASGIPVLVMHGKRDRRLWSKRSYADMADRLGADHVIIEEASHSPNIEQPEETARALLGFMARNDSPAQPGVTVLPRGRR